MSEKGHGRIRVSAELWSMIGSPETPDAWHKAILLSDTVEIMCVERCDYATPGRSLFELYVLSEMIPQSETLIEVSLVHRRDGDVVSLDRIQMSTWDGEHWRTVEPVGERIRAH